MLKLIALSGQSSNRSTTLRYGNTPLWTPKKNSSSSSAAGHCDLVQDQNNLKNYSSIPYLEIYDQKEF